MVDTFTQQNSRERKNPSVSDLTGQFFSNFGRNLVAGTPGGRVLIEDQFRRDQAGAARQQLAQEQQQEQIRRLALADAFNQISQAQDPAQLTSAVSRASAFGVDPSVFNFALNPAFKPVQTINPITGQPVFSGQFGAVARRERAAPKSAQTVVNVGDAKQDPFVGKEREELAKASVRVFSDIQEQSRQASDKRADLDALREINPETGAFAPFKAKISGLFEGLGITGGESAKDFQSATKIVTNLGLGRLKGEGAVSDRERDLIKDATAKLTDVNDAFKFSINRLDNAFFRQELRGILARDLSRERGTTENVDVDVERALGRIPNVVANPKGGLPLFFSEFRRKAVNAARNRGERISENQIIQQWQSISGVQ